MRDYSGIIEDDIVYRRLSDVWAGFYNRIERRQAGRASCRIRGRYSLIGIRVYTCRGQCRIAWQKGLDMYVQSLRSSSCGQWPRSTAPKIVRFLLRLVSPAIQEGLGQQQNCHLAPGMYQGSIDVVFCVVQ